MLPGVPAQAAASRGMLLRHDRPRGTLEEENPRMKKMQRCGLGCVSAGIALVFLSGFSWAHEPDADAPAPLLPPGFFDETIAGPWSNPVGLTFAPDGRMVVWSKDGRLWVTDADGTTHASPVLDIHDEVGEWRDHGMLGCALDPDFLVNGRVYLLYVVDYHHLALAGTAEYDDDANSYFHSSIARIARYQLEVDANFQSVVAGSRTVLVGETLSTGIPILHESHGIGTLAFGTDGTLLASCGDSASYLTVDDGGFPGGSWGPQALGLGIIPLKEEIGAYRAQLVDSHCGKILRIDPETGDGVPSNPFYDAGEPRAPRSRVWSLGLRNPFRFCVRPETGSHAPSDGDPGVLYIGDVGWDNWEELNIAGRPAVNFGWPLYEGMNPLNGYAQQDMENPDAPNNLGCTTNFLFSDLLLPATQTPPRSAPHPCDAGQTIPRSIPWFVYQRPALDWSHSGTARVATFDESGQPTTANIGAAGSPVSGPQFGGSASVGGVWYTGEDFPPEFRDTYFHADWTGGWIRAMRFDENDNPLEIVGTGFAPGSAATSLAMHPTEGGIWFVRNGSSIRRIRYGGNIPPTAVIGADVFYGASPLVVQFTGTSSSDPESQALSYAWDFGDGSPVSSNPEPLHTFTALAGIPTGYMVTLTVTDTEGGTAQMSMVISVNNTPPVVTITSPVDGSTYSILNETTVALNATIVDAETSLNELTCAWQTILHHNEHTHAEPIDPECATSALLSPIGCDDNTYFYTIRLTVTDDAGLSTVQEVVVMPACDPAVACVADCAPDNGDGTFGNGNVTVDDLVAVVNAFGAAGGACDIAPDNGDGTFGDGVVNIDDIITVINNFGPCE